jgi:RNA polymerase sigma-70 factor (ECF subfamily)
LPVAVFRPSSSILPAENTIMSTHTLFATNEILSNKPVYVIPSDENPLAEIVRAAQCGDRKAFGHLIEKYEGAVYATVFRRLGNHAEAQELCQDVFIQAMRKLNQLEDPRCFGGWIRSIAARMAINYAVRRGPRMSGDRELLENGRVENRTPLVTILAREREDQVRRGLRKLRTMDRQTLEAFYFEGSSLLEMSRKFETPVGTIKRRLHVARKRLAKELEALTPA